MLVMTTPQDGQIIGHIEFYKTVNYLDEYELVPGLFARPPWDRRLYGSGEPAGALPL